MTRRNFCEICWILGLLLLTGGALAGQSYQSFESEMNGIIENARFRLGPFRLAFRLPLMRILGYNSNVFYYRQGETPVSDYTSTFSPEVTAFYLWRNSLILHFTENPEYAFYFRERGERLFANSFSTGLKYLFLHRVAISAEYYSRSHKHRVSSEIDRQLKDTIRGFNLRIFYETARRTSLGLAATADKYIYEDTFLSGMEDPLSHALNRQERSGYFEFNYRLFSDTNLFYRVGLSSYDFDYAQSAWRNAHSFQTYGGLNFPLWGRVRGGLSLGYKKLAPQTSGMQSTATIIGNTSLEWRSGRLSVRGGYYRDFLFSYWENIWHFITDRLNFGFSFYPTMFLRLDYGLNWEWLTYPDSVVQVRDQDEIVFSSEKDRLVTHSFGVIFRVVRSFGIGLTAEIWRRMSDSPQRQVNQSFLGFYFTQSF